MRCRGLTFKCSPLYCLTLECDLEVLSADSLHGKREGVVIPRTKKYTDDEIHLHPYRRLVPVTE